MLGSAFEAEDAVQETLVRAWRNLDRFDADRAPMRSPLFTIATNICLDMPRSAQRRARAMDLGLVFASARNPGGGFLNGACRGGRGCNLGSRTIAVSAKRRRCRVTQCGPCGGCGGFGG
jgi:hypothetical protein